MDPLRENWPDDLNPTPIELLLIDPAIGRPSPLPGHTEERRRLDDLPNELCARKECDWETRIGIARRNLAAAYDFLYEGACAHLPGLDGDPTDTLILLGYWD